MEDQSGKSYLGFLAQYLVQYFPEAVHIPTDETEKGENFYSVDYGSLSVVALKAIQEQQEKITSLQQQLDQQDQLISTLISRLEALENQ